MERAVLNSPMESKPVSGPQETHHPTVSIAYRPIMELLRPSLFGIHPGKLHQHGRLETGAFRFVQMLTAIYLIIYLSGCRPQYNLLHKTPKARGLKAGNLGPQRNRADVPTHR